MPTARGQTFGAVWRYPGKRGVVWRIRYRDASGRRVLETLGPEPEWNARRAKAELKRRQVDVERAGYTRPDVVRLADFAAEWLSDYLPARRLKATTVASYEGAIRAHLVPMLGHHHPDRAGAPPRADRPLCRPQTARGALAQDRHQPTARAAAGLQARGTPAADRRATRCPTWSARASSTPR